MSVRTIKTLINRLSKLDAKLAVLRNQYRDFADEVEAAAENVRDGSEQVHDALESLRQAIEYASDTLSERV